MIYFLVQRHNVKKTINKLRTKQKNKNRTENRVNWIFTFRISGDYIITFLRFFLVFVEKNTCRELNLPVMRVYKLLLFAMCSMNIHICCAAAQLQQCTRGRHNSTSCGQVVATYTTLRQHTGLQQQRTTYIYGVACGQPLISSRNNQDIASGCGDIACGTFTDTSACRANTGKKS